MPYSRDSYIFFWRETETYGWGSQWYHSPFRARIQIPFGNTHTIDSAEEYDFPTAEHWMMACKAMLFGDSDALARILATPFDDPREVKRLGRTVQNFDTERWEAVRTQVVVQGNLHKFRQNGELREALLATGVKRIVEASPRDRIWGIGYGEKRALEMRDNWGLNLLGKALEEVRGVLREEEAGKSEAEVEAAPPVNELEAGTCSGESVGRAVDS